MKKAFSLLIVVMLLMESFPLVAQSLSREHCIEDARQMVRLVETCHPDPYERVGGKIGFHLAFHRLLEEIPGDGMSNEDFWWLLSGFLAGIEDGHTYLYPLKHPDAQHPGGIPLRFKVLADSVLTIQQVPSFCDTSYIGSRVIGINGIAVDGLLQRVAALYPMENIFDRFRNLKLYLWYGDYLKRLLPNWAPGDSVSVQVIDAAGHRHVLDLPTANSSECLLRGADGSSLHLPNTETCDFVFDWIGHDHRIGYIRIDKQDEYREYAEQAIAGLASIDNPQLVTGYRRQYLSIAHQWHERYYGSPGPDSLELIIEKLPSFTEFMLDITSRLKEAKTDHLVIDLRNNRGGISLMSDILIYFLFGKKQLSEVHADSYVITYHSEPGCRAAASLDVEALNRNRGGDQAVPLQIGDYDFYSLDKWAERTDESEWTPVDPSFYSTTKTFYSEYITGKHAGWFSPKYIYVIASDNTFSAGYETLVSFIKCGAVFVGVPPAQSGNCFGMGVEPVAGLTHSGIRLQISVRKIIMFPDDERKGYLLHPTIPLNYRTFQQYDYDRNAAVRMIIDRISRSD